MRQFEVTFVLQHRVTIRAESPEEARRLSTLGAAQLTRSPHAQAIHTEVVDIVVRDIVDSEEVS